MSRLNDSVKGWTKDAKGELDAQFDKLGIEHRSNSPSATSARELLKSFVGMKFGVVSVVSFKFPRHMVFVEKGVGKGSPINARKRKGKPWFSDPMEKKVEELADIVAEEQGDLILSRFKL